MKYPSIAAALFVLFAPAAMAANDHASHGADSSHAAPAQAVALSEGMVKKVDKGAGKVTLTHGPLANLGMPPMTMVFRVKDAAWLEQMKAGDRIRFLADRVDGAFTVVRYEPAN